MTQSSSLEHLRQPQRKSSVLVAMLGFLLPGLGYWAIGERKRAIISGSSILTLFFLGLLIAGIRIVDVPGFDAMGTRHYVRNTEGKTEWALTAAPMATLMEKPWFVPQMLMGPTGFVAGGLSLVAASNEVPKNHATLPNIGTLYTLVAGMLNLLVLIDAAHRNGKRAA